MTQQFCDKCNDRITSTDIPPEFIDHWAAKLYLEKLADNQMSLCFLCFLETCVAVKRLQEYGA